MNGEPAGSPETTRTPSAEGTLDIPVGDRVVLDVSMCTGTLRLESWSGEMLQVTCASDQRTRAERVEHAEGRVDGDVVELTGRDCRVRVPESVAVEVVGVSDSLLLAVGLGVAATVRAQAAPAAGAAEGPGDWADEFARSVADAARQLETQLGDWAPRFAQQLLDGLRAGRHQTERWRHEFRRAGREAEDWARQAEERSRHASEQAAAFSRRAEDAARRHAERAAAHLQREIERAQERVRREAARAARATARAERPAGPSWEMRGAQRAPESPRSDEERLAVLRMLSEGRITPEQAAQLLSALSP